MAIRILTVLTLGAMITLTGCGLFDSVGWSQAPGEQPQWVTQLAALPYPGEDDKGEPLDVIVEPHDYHLEVTNVSARSFSSVQLWINQEYVTIVESLAPGQGTRLSMDEFINHYGESFPTGSFLSPDKGRPLVSADIYDPATGRLHSITVRTKPDIFGR